MVATRSPRNRLINALGIDVPARATTVVRPKNTAAKYSGAPNLRANSLSGVAKVVITAVETSPPVSAATSAQPRAFEASPRWVIA